MPSLHLSPTFSSFLLALGATHVEYLMVGGHAVQYYGYLRPTEDLDVWIGTHPQNAAKVLAVCQGFGSGIPELPQEPFQHENRIIRIEIPPIAAVILDPIIGQQPAILRRYQGSQTEQIEILTVQSGVNFDACFAERIVDTLAGIKVNIISLHHLKAIKQAGGRPQDLDDLLHLE